MNRMTHERDENSDQKWSMKCIILNIKISTSKHKMRNMHKIKRKQQNRNRAIFHRAEEVERERSKWRMKRLYSEQIEEPFHDKDKNLQNINRKIKDEPIILKSKSILASWKKLQRNKASGPVEIVIEIQSDDLGIAKCFLTPCPLRTYSIMISFLYYLYIDMTPWKG